MGVVGMRVRCGLSGREWRMAVGLGMLVIMLLLRRWVELDLGLTVMKVGLRVVVISW